MTRLETELPEIAAGLNLLSKHDFVMLPKIRSPAPGGGGTVCDRPA